MIDSSIFKSRWMASLVGALLIEILSRGRFRSAFKRPTVHVFFSEHTDGWYVSILK